MNILRLHVLASDIALDAIRFRVHLFFLHPHHVAKPHRLPAFPIKQRQLRPCRVNLQLTPVAGAGDLAAAHAAVVLLADLVVLANPTNLVVGLLLVIAVMHILVFFITVMVMPGMLPIISSIGGTVVSFIIGTIVVIIMLTSEWPWRA
jgi:hypothetical protein